MRLFIAIDLPDALKDQLTSLKTDMSGASWTRRDNLHLTLRFLGDGIAESRLSALQHAFAAIELPTFDVTVQGVGRFPLQEKKAARVLWVGIAPNPPLAALYASIEQAVVALGFPPDDHAFHPHLTLARLKSDRRAPAVDTFLKQQASFHAPAFCAEAFHVYSSELTQAGARYTRITGYHVRCAQGHQSSARQQQGGCYRH
ncbi:MAG: RNA 2',3'-cyclic phosphodiesterase [Chloroflexota bacterium]|nr:RNA 2',3'-cyclic phosphodiesterase [Chloroflexota bacterium]